MQANLLRTVLTALIVTLGITALVGILTAVDGIQYSVTDSLAELGVNVFQIDSKRSSGRRRGGRTEQNFPPVRYKEIQRFEREYNFPSTTISTFTSLTGVAEIKRGSKKTNPNIQVIGVTEEYIALEGLNIAICGDIAHSRVANSNMILLEKMGAHVKIIAPESLMPQKFPIDTVESYTSMEEGLKDCDVVMMLYT